MLVILLAVLSACSGSSDFNAQVEKPGLDVSGFYVTTSAVGSLGTLYLTLEPIEGAGRDQYYEATLYNDLEDTLGRSKGAASVGNNHLVVNFDTGLEGEFYLEAVIETTGNEVTALDGQFVFPDQTETLPVRFEDLTL